MKSESTLILIFIYHSLKLFLPIYLLIYIRLLTRFKISGGGQAPLLCSPLFLCLPTI